MQKIFKQVKDKVIMHKSEWQEPALILKQLLSLESSPVALICSKNESLKPLDKKERICRAILDAAAGRTVRISAGNNACFGAAWHLGFHRIKDPKVMKMIQKFVVEGEKLFCSYDALNNMITQMGPVPDNSHSCFVLSPMDKCEYSPQLVIFICDAASACRLLTLVTFIDGNMPGIKIGGPTCRMAVTYPLLTDEVNISFYDYTARKICNVPRDKLLVSIPYKKISRITKSIDSCSAGRASIEYPQEFREFLKKRLNRD